MKRILPAALIAVVASAGMAYAQSNGASNSKDVGYKSGASDSGRSGMDSSRGVPTTPTAGRPGTTDNGNPTGPSGNGAGGQHN